MPEDEQERWQVLADLENWLERPMLILSFIWLSLVLIELIWTTSGVFELLGTIIWIIFILEFVLRFALAPRKINFLRRNPITIIALIAPAFRFLRVLRLLRLSRGLRLVRIVGTANRSMKALRTALHRRHFGYVAGLTVLIVLLGAAGMMNFEPAREVSGGFTSYGHALWWTAMLVTSIGSDFWPVTTEGRVLTLLLSTYGLAVFGYITASFASFFVGRDAEAPDGPVAGREDVAQLARQIRELRLALSQTP